ncbi:hypothetical protein LTR53_017345, partial [Teratosphaeriaceae sp. CCFEE 6253]
LAINPNPAAHKVAHIIDHVLLTNQNNNAPHPAVQASMSRRKSLANSKRDSNGRFTKVAAPDSADTSRFLALPAELRNTIYRFALVPPGEINVEGPARMQPALLRASRQLRQEALSIYYSDNRFSFTVQNMCGVGMVHFRVLLKKYRSKAVHGNFARYLGQGLHWGNLMEWMGASHAEPKARAGWSFHQMACSKCRVVGAAFDIVREMRKDEWAKVETVLQAYHEGVAAANPAWK